MGNFLERATQEGNRYEEARRAAAHLQEELPCLYSVLTGIEPKGETVGLLPGSVRIYTWGGQLRAMLSGEKWENLAYLDCGPHLRTLAQIDEAIRDGNMVWKKASDRKNSYPDPAF